MLKPYIKTVLAGDHLDAETMRAAVGLIMDGEGTPAQIAAFLVALRCKGETASEIAGAAAAMRARMTTVSVDRSPLLDTCGTGGDGAGTFNISTAVAFVCAAAGVGVAKHGNKAISSKSGSADLLRELGVNIAAPPDTVRHCIEEVGIGFLFAPNHHPAMKHAAPIRRELGIRTVFNVLGPLTNPAGAPLQLLGVFDRNLLNPMAEVLGRLGSKRAWIVHGSDGLDELTVCGPSYVCEWDGQQVNELTIEPESVGLPVHGAADLAGGEPEHNAQLFKRLMAGELPGAIEDAVALNGGAGLLLAEQVSDLRAGVERSREVIRSGAVLELLGDLVQRTQAS